VTLLGLKKYIYLYSFHENVLTQLLGTSTDPNDDMQWQWQWKQTAMATATMPMSTNGNSSDKKWQ